jgi:hypothetical protein
MIEIEEVNHALDLARDRAEAGMRHEAAGIMADLDRELGGHVFGLKRAQWDVTSGHAIDWGDLRDEAHLAVNAQIIAAMDREAKRGKGRDKLNRGRKFEAADRMDEVRAVYRPGLSAEKVRQKLESAGTSMPLRSVQRYLKKIREG